MIVQLLYTSRSTEAMNEEEWGRLEELSPVYNALNGITGFCCYDGHGFMQLLEGREDRVDELLAKIAADHRHCELVILHRGSAAFASYGEWAMRSVRLSENGADRKSDIERIMAPSLSPELKALMLSWKTVTTRA